MGFPDFLAVALWDACGPAIGRSNGQVNAAVESLVRPTVVSRIRPSCIRAKIRLGTDQLEFALRVDFPRAPGAALTLDGVTFTENARLPSDAPFTWGSVKFAPKNLELSVVQEGVTRVMGGILKRSAFMPLTHELAEIAEIHSLEIGLDEKVGLAHQIQFTARSDETRRALFERVGFALTRGNGTLFTEDDERLYDDVYGPGAAWPRDVRWRRVDGSELDVDRARFGKAPARFFQW